MPRLKKLTAKEKANISPDQEACLDAINARLDALHALESAFKRKNEAEGFEQIMEYTDFLCYLAENLVEKHHDFEKKWDKLDETNGDKKEIKTEEKTNDK
tara:strand:+ start:213 stop:512 length:300 start_codon:yes stop_codon:yes gene_type:complete